VSNTGTHKRVDNEALQAVNNIQHRFLERIGDRVADGLSLAELSQELIIEALDLCEASYGCVLRLNPDRTLALNSAVSRAADGSSSAQHDTLLNRMPDALMSDVINRSKPTFSNDAARMISANLPSCLPRVRSFMLLPIHDKSDVNSLLFIANPTNDIDVVMLNRVQSMLDAFIQIHLNKLVNKGIRNIIADITLTRQQLITLLGTTFDGVITIDEYAIIGEFNPASERMFGMSAEMAIGSSLGNFIPSDVLTNILDQAEIFLTTANTKEPRPMRVKNVLAMRSSGQEFSVEIDIFHAVTDEQVLTTMVVHDVTDRVQSIREMQDTIIQFETLTRLAPIGILKLNSDWTCEYANAVWYELSGQRGDEALGGGWVEAFLEEDRGHTLKEMQTALNDGETYNSVVCLKTKNDHPRYVTINASCLRDELQLQIGCMLVVTDITSQHLAERRLQQISYQDPLTELPNRASFLRLLNRSLETRRPVDTVALLYIGLDGFKAINDTWGHATGDELLRQVATRIQQTVREHDAVARLGGDQFSVIINSLSSESDINVIAYALNQALTEPFLLEAEEVTISASIGISSVSGEIADTEQEVASMLKQADVALHRAKHSGRSRHEMYAEELDQAQNDKSALLTSLRKSVAKQDFELHYQPQVLIEKQRLLGFEALLRWPQETGGHVSPAVFIDVLEETGLIGELGEWALNEACGQYRIWLKKGLIGPATTMSVNVSARQLGMPGFADRVATILARHSMRPDSLILEITESAIVQIRETGIIHRLKQLGVQISLDDFGTGYSSLAYLSQLPLDHLKIDRSFIADLSRSPHATSIIKSIIALANTLGIRVIAEGVEDSGVFPLLLEQGCEGYQGYYFSKPLPAREMAARLKEITPVRLSHYANFIDLDEAVSV